MDRNGASKRLLKGTVIYMIGNMSSKILQMLILPLITGILLTEEYGYYDLIITTINLVMPIVTLQVIEGMFRFAFESDEKDTKQLITSTTAFLLVGIAFLGGIIFFASYLFPMIQYPFLIYLNYIGAIFFNYSQKLSRTKQFNKQFAISGVLHTASMLALQALTLFIFNMRVDGMLIASCGSYFVAGLYLQFYVHAYRYISKNAFDLSELKKLISYSAPLVPNSIAWWLVASSDRYVITYFIGTSANGIYSIAGKFSQLLTFATGVFQLAWQESAIIESNSKERDSFYTRTFNTYVNLLFSSYLVILPMIRFMFPILIDTKFQEAYIYNPILLIGAVFSAISQFYGTAYIVFKKTSGAFYTSLIAAVINIAIGVGTVKYIGLFGPAIGTAAAFLAQWIVRSIQLRDCFRIKIEYKSLLPLVFMCLVTAILYYFNNIFIWIVQLAFGLTIFLLVNKKYIATLASKLKGKF